MPTPARLLTTMLLAAGLAIPVPTAAASVDAVIADCTDGQLQGHYTQSDYAAALANLPNDVSEYTPCRAVITAARDRDLAATARGAAATRLGAGSTSTPAAAVPGSPEAGDGAAAPDGGQATGATPTVTPAPGTTPAVDGGTGGDDPSAALAALAAGIPVDDDDPSAGSGNGLPAIPIVLAFCVIALSGARALQWWGNRPEPVDPGAEPA